MNGAAIQSKIAKVLSRLNATSRVVMFRAVVASGGNATLGLGRVVTSTDIVADPPPAVELITALPKPETFAAAGALVQAGDYRLTFAGTYPESTFTTNEIIYGTDVLKIIFYNPAAIDGTVVAWDVIARAVKVA